MEIREKRLYRIQGHDTFEAYCQEKWQFSRSYAHRIMEAAEIAADLLPIGNVAQTESQARELARLPDPESRREVWQHVHEEHGENVTAAKVRAAVRLFTDPEQTAQHVMAAAGLVAEMSTIVDTPPKSSGKSSRRFLKNQKLGRFARAISLNWPH